MYTLLIVDDEKYTREGIIGEINWESLGISSVLEAKNGLEAYDIIVNSDVDILISDIRMPKMNGIDLAYKLQALKPECPIIFMSGYSDKEFLKSAIELNAVRYIEKPLDIDELIVAIKKSIVIIEQNKSNLQFRQLTLPLVLNNLAIDLSTSSKSFDNVKPLLKKEFPSFSVTGFFQTLILMNKSREDRIDQLLDSSMIDSVLKDLDTPYIWGYKNSQHLIIHIKLTQSSKLGVPLEQLLGIQKGFVKCQSQYIYILVAGTVVLSSHELIHSYQEAVSAANRYFLHPELQVLYPIHSEDTNFEFIEQFHLNYKEALQKNDYTTCKDIVIHSVNHAKKYSFALEGILRSYFYQFIRLSLFHVSTFESNHIALNETLSSSDFFSLPHIDAIEEYILTMIDGISQSNHNPKYDSELVNLTIEYINTHYSDTEMSLQSIADGIHISVSHMCVQFKKETDLTINQYIIHTRIRQSMLLLADQDSKLSFITMKVGFNDSNYFSKLFKKSMGMSPSRYRELLLNGKTTTTD